MITFGTKQYSVIGRYCPVLLKNNRKFSVQSFGNHPILVGDEIYYLKSKQNILEFQANPARYIKQGPPQPILATTLCILGNPKSGKTTLGKKLASVLDAVHLTVSTILQIILDGQEVTSLHEQIKTTLESGNTLSDATIADAIFAVTNRLIANGQG